MSFLRFTIASAYGIRLAFSILVATLTAALPNGAVAQAYPDRPIKLIVGFPPGGGTDLYARLIAHAMEKTMKQSIVVENRAGAAGTIGATMAARSKPDGYTLLLALTGSFSVAPIVTPDIVQYKVPDDFSPIGLIAEVPLGLFVANHSKFQSLQDLVTHAKTQISFYGSSGSRSTTNIAMEWLNVHYGMNASHIPYGGGGPATVDLMAGRVDSYFSPVSPLMSHVRQGSLRLLAVTGEQRMKVMPEVPVLKELGIEKNFSMWYGLVAPRGTPPEVQQVLAEHLRTALQDPEVIEQIERDGGTIRLSFLDEFKDYISTDIQKYREVTSDIPKDKL